MSKDIKNSVPKPGKLPSPPRREGNSVVRSLLGSRLGEFEANKNADALLVTLDKLSPNPDQPRQVYDPEQELELAASIKQYGVLEPILVRKLEGGTYQIIAGERRFRAAKEAGLSEVPVIVREANEREARLLALVENLQRADLDELDEARYYQFLIEQFNSTEQEIANFVHRSRSYINKRLKLLKNQTNVSRKTEEAVANSEINNKLPQNTSKLNISQSASIKASRFTKKFINFNSFLDEAKEQLPAIEQEDKAALGEQLKELRTRIEEFEKLLE